MFVTGSPSPGRRREHGRPVIGDHGEGRPALTRARPHPTRPLRSQPRPGCVCASTALALGCPRSAETPNPGVIANRLGPGAMESSASSAVRGPRRGAGPGASTGLDPPPAGSSPSQGVGALEPMRPITDGPPPSGSTTLWWRRALTPDQRARGRTDRRPRLQHRATCASSIRADGSPPPFLRQTRCSTGALTCDLSFAPGGRAGPIAGPASGGNAHPRCQRDSEAIRSWAAGGGRGRRVPPRPAAGRSGRHPLGPLRRRRSRRRWSPSGSGRRSRRTRPNARDRRAVAGALDFCVAESAVTSDRLPVGRLSGLAARRPPPYPSGRGAPPRPRGRAGRRRVDDRQPAPSRDHAGRPEGLQALPLP